MNNNGFNGQIELPEELCERAKDAVKAAVAKHNQVHRKRKTVLLSTAACLAVFAISIVSVKYFKQDQLAPSRNTTNGILSATTDNSVNTPTKNDTVIYLENNNDKPAPQSFALNGKIYTQYSVGKSYEDTKIKINRSDIGELICELGAENLQDYCSLIYEKWTDTIFLNAKVYRYANAKSDNIMVAQTTDNVYYLFYLNGLTSDNGMADLLNAYTADSANEIIGIEIWQNAIKTFPANDPSNDLGYDITTTRPILKGTLKDKNKIQSVLSILAKEHDKFTDYNNPEFVDGTDNDNKLMSDYGIYDLRIVFSDGQELELPSRNIDYTAALSTPGTLLPDPSTLDIRVQKLCIDPQNGYEGHFCGPYSLSRKDYNKLAAILEKYMS